MMWPEWALHLADLVIGFGLGVIFICALIFISEYYANRRGRK